MHVTGALASVVEPLRSSNVGASALQLQPRVTCRHLRDQFV